MHFEIVPAICKEHRLTGWDVITNPTCTEDGLKKAVCTVCGSAITEVIPATGHKWNAEYTEDKAATCIEEGLKSIHCSACDEIKEGSSKAIPKTDHQYGDWNIATEPTVDHEGIREHSCIICGTTESETIAKLTPSDTPADTSSDTPADTSSDTPTDTPSDTSTDTPIGMPSDAPSETPSDSPSDTPELSTDTVNQTGADGTALGEGASAEAAEAAIAGMTSDKDLSGTVFSKLQLRSKKQTKTSIKLSWKKVSGAKSYVIYGNKCGKSNVMQKLVTSKGQSKTIKKILGKKLKKGTYYKFMIVALDKNNNVVSSSKIIHVATKGDKVGNVGKVTTKAKKNKVSIKKGKTFKLKGKQVAASKKLKVKKHRVLKYETTNKKIATVSSKGVIKGKKKGTCYVYAYAQNGVFAKIKVTVK